ncbi:unnamed protein product [Hymenolepis diminuta]|uniref:Uncharacterized protein n=1 Tax=Hymenolepis diminuta TaxID=6216 RepID=A0A564YR41_HYMDI|nr:unnamed protein product [Hymenolepis diminuta]
MGSCAQMSNDPERGLKIRRRTFSHFDPSIVTKSMRRFFDSDDINPLEQNIM